MIIGFTGTRNGMTEEQKSRLWWLLYEDFAEFAEFHHGCEEHADLEAANITFRFRDSVPTPTIHGHPACFNGGHVSTGTFYDSTTHPPLPPLERNQVIVDTCSWLIACPGEFEEQQRSGTWSTIRRARKSNRDHTIIYPDGSTKTVTYTKGEA